MKELFSGPVGKICLAMLAIGTGIPIIVLARYWSSLGPVSHDPQDWSAFGSIMAGSFTFLAAVSTSATLLILIKQRSDSEKVTQDQLIALRFEQYIKHRALFMERLDALEFRFNRDFIFVERDYLYRSLFPENSAAKMSYAAGPQLTGYVDSLYKIWQLASSLARNGAFERAKELCVELLSLFHKLGISWQNDGEEGSVSYLGNYIGLNLLSLPAGLRRLDYIIESLTHFGGAQLGQPRESCEKFAMVKLRDEFYTAAWSSGEATINLKTQRDDRLHAFYDLYQYLRDTMHGSHNAFPALYNIIREILDGQHGCEYLTDADKMGGVLNKCLTILFYVQPEINEDPIGLDEGAVIEKINNLARRMSIGKPAQSE